MKTVKQIIYKVTILTLRESRYKDHDPNFERIIKASENMLHEKMRDEWLRGYKEGLNIGIDTGFECAIAASRAEITLPEKLDQVDGPSEMQQKICGTLKPKS